MSIDAMVEDALAAALAKYISTRATFDDTFITKLAVAVVKEQAKVLRAQEAARKQEEHDAMMKAMIQTAQDLRTTTAITQPKPFGFSSFSPDYFRKLIP